MKIPVFKQTNETSYYYFKLNHYNKLKLMLQATDKADMREQPTIVKAQNVIFKNYLDMNVWQLRHLEVSRFVQAHQIKNILDIGCAQGTLINRLSRSELIQKLIGIDFSTEVLQTAMHNVQPELMQDSISYLRQNPLVIQLYHLNMLKPLPLFKFGDIQLVTLIQFIEHINQSDLQTLCQQIFRKIHPKYVIITTPNQQFNVHFKFQPGQMRHPQHLFEWNRKQFQLFCQNISRQFEYNYQIFGVGEHVNEQKFGFCSQGAFFTQKSNQKQYDPNEQEQKQVEPYEKIRYPFWKDNIESKIQSQIKYIIGRNNYQNPQVIAQLMKNTKIGKKILKGQLSQVTYIDKYFIIQQVKTMKYCGYCSERDWVYYQYESSSISDQSFINYEQVQMNQIQQINQ